MRSQASCETPFSAFRRAMRHLPTEMRRKTFGLLAILLASAGVETLFAAATALFVTAISNPETVLQSKAVTVLHQVMGADFLRSRVDLTLATAGFLLLVVLLKNTFMPLGSYLIARFAVSIEAHFGRRLLRGFLNMPYEWHLSRNTADLVLGVQWTSYLGMNLIFPFMKLIGDALILVFMLVTILALTPLPSLLVFLGIGGASALLLRRIHRTLDRVAVSCREVRLGVNRESTKAIHGVKDARISGRVSSFDRNYARRIRPLPGYVGLRILLSQLPFCVVETLGIATMCVFVVAMFVFTSATSAKITGIITLLAASAWRALPALGRILNGLTAIRSSLPFATTELDYLDEIPSRPHDLPGQSLQRLDFEQSVRLENVDFRYQGAERDSLNGVDMTIGKGETLGIIGTSGAGKSTLVDLLIGLLPPTRGKVLIDGRHLDEDLALRWIRNLGYVPQSPYICDGTLAENVAFGVPPGEIDRERVLQACRMAAVDFLDQLPQGLDTPIGERGAKLSGGQRQRVAIARALYNDPEVMIFDEATSSLDQASERVIHDTIYSLKGSKTLLIIAHRLTTVEKCDRVVWIEGGRIRAMGPAGQILNQYREQHGGEERSGSPR